MQHDPAQRAKAQLVIVTGLLVIYFFTKNQYVLYAALAVGILCVFVPIVGDWIVTGWFKLAEVLGNINGKILLSILFWVFLFPIALLYRLSAKNPMSVKHTNEPSLYHVRDHQYKKEDLENTW